MSFFETQCRIGASRKPSDGFLYDLHCVEHPTYQYTSRNSESTGVYWQARAVCDLVTRGGITKGQWPRDFMASIIIQIEKKQGGQGMCGFQDN